MRFLSTVSAVVVVSVQAHASCVSEVGARQANLDVTQCRDVSPATRPPCNIANACALIISEIKRGCEFLKTDAPAYCSQCWRARACCKS